MECRLLRTAICCLLTALAVPSLDAAWPPAVPAALTLEVRETASIARSGEVLISGVPLPQSLGLTDPATLTVVDGSGTPVAAQIRVLARWHAPLADTTAPIQWLQVAFPASVAASGTAGYRLVLDGSAGPNPAPATTLSVNQNGNTVTVDTGAAVFRLGGASDRLFDEISAGGTTLATGSPLTARAESSDVGHPTIRAVRVEHAGPLTAVVVIEGAYALSPVGGGGLGSFRRYLFRAGSPVAEVRHAVQWEGDRCGVATLDCGGGQPNALWMERVRDPLSLSLGGSSVQVTALGDRSSAAVSGTLAGGQSAAVRQLLRADHLDPLAFSVTVGASSASGVKADGGLLAATGSAGTVAAAIARMHRYEPQAVRLLADGRLAVDLLDGTAWLGTYQGLFATFGVAAWDGTVDRATLERELWAPLNRPLRAWPTAAWFAASQAVPELPSGALPSDLTAYDTLVPAVLGDTLTKIDTRGLAGILTFGLYPRIWGNPIYTDEIDCVDHTPGLRWDNKYWCATWTDYHNTVATAPMWAMRSGEVEWLDELAVPGALRQLHTQILQCSPASGYFYCGQAPAGYGAYRSNFNGSHAYFHNLVLYYWLTGDETVLRTLGRGAQSMRDFMCPGRGATPQGAVCPPAAVPVDDWAAVNGRTASQWYWVFRLLGLAGDDPSYLDDWTSNTARWLTLYYAQPSGGGDVLGFMSTFNGSLTSNWVGGPGTYWSDQLWMASLYDFDLLQRLAVDTGNAPLGAPAVTPLGGVSAWGQTLLDVANLSTWSNGGPDAPWPNEVRYTFAGPRIGGTLTDLAEEIDGDGDGTPCEICGDDDGGLCLDLCLYDTGKAPLSGLLMRAADATGDPALDDLGRAFTLFTLDRAGADVQPLGKLMGEYLTLLHPAVARAAGVGGELFRDGFESGDLTAWSASTGDAAP